MKNKDWNEDAIFDHFDEENSLENNSDSLIKLAEEYKEKSLQELFEKDYLEKNSKIFQDHNLELRYVSLEERERTNQGLGHSKNPSRWLCDRWYVRHYTEACMNRAAKRRNFINFPGCAADMGLSGERREFDNFLIERGTGNFGFLEVQGRSHDNELAIVRDQRVQEIRDLGFFVKHYEVPIEGFDDYIKGINWAEECLKDFSECLRRHFRKPTWEDYSK